MTSGAVARPQEGGLQKLQKFFVRKSRLLNNRLERSSLQVAIVKRNSHAKSWFCRMLQNVMASGHAMNEEPSALKRFELIPWAERLEDFAS